MIVDESMRLDVNYRLLFRSNLGVF
jgi:hypothetical protein